MNYMEMPYKGSLLVAVFASATLEIAWMASVEFIYWWEFCWLARPNADRRLARLI